MAARKKIVAVRTFQRYKAWASRSHLLHGQLDRIGRNHVVIWHTRDFASQYGTPVRVEVTVRVIERKAKR